jgi:hypothetical protein
MEKVKKEKIKTKNRGNSVMLFGVTENVGGNYGARIRVHWLMS